MNQYLKVALLFLLALSLRIAFAAYTGFNEPNFAFDYDASEYHHIGLGLSQGQGFCLAGKPTAKRPPVYPIFLAVLYYLFGVKIWLVKIAQALLGALSCLLLYFLAQNLFDKRVAGLALLTSAIYPHFIFYPAYLLTETLFQLLLLIFTFLMCKLEDEFSPVRLLLSGLILGIAVLCRPVIVFLPLFLFFWYLLFHRERWAGIATALVLGLSMTLVILPWATRNYLAMNNFIPLSTQSGVTLYGANNLEIYGNFKARGGWLPPTLKLDNLPEAEQSLKYWELTIDFWRTYPKESANLLLFKFYRFWNPWPQTALIYQLISLFTYAPILILFVYYLLFSKDRGRENLLPVIGIIVYFVCFSLLVYGSTRFRFPIEPLLIILAAKALLREEGQLNPPQTPAFQRNQKIPTIKV